MLGYVPIIQTNTIQDLYASVNFDADPYTNRRFTENYLAPDVETHYTLCHTHTEND